MSTELTIHKPASNVLTRIGTPEERQYLIQIMAEQIGIPASDATRTDVVALLAAAAQRTLQYGWMPGLHMHVQKFETSNSKKAREQNPNARPVYSYSLVDGEKAWKDSGTRWRERGVQWKYQRKPMTPAEVREEARLQGCTKPLASNAFGMWSRIVVLGQDDPNDPDNPLWSAGVYTGWMKAGNYWNNDNIPTGVSSRDIAIRRADKRAMMQSTLTLLPVDDLSVNQRAERLTNSLREEAAQREWREAPMSRPERVVVEEDGDVLWAKPSGARAGATLVEDGDITDGDFDAEGEFYAHPSPEDDAPVLHPEVDFDRPTRSPGARPADAGARPADAGARPADAGARPADAGARPVNKADGPCPECHAPVGKPHATGCTAIAAPPDARPVEVDARPVTLPGARPVEVDARPVAPIDQLYEDLAQYHLGALNGDAQETIRKIRYTQKDSAMPMSDKYFAALVSAICAEIGNNDPEMACMILTLMLGFKVSDKSRPGQLVHAFLMKPLRDRNKTMRIVLCDIAERITARLAADTERTGENG